jgi:hypothetical protein
MAENTQTTDAVLDILSAAFGPTVAAEVVKDEKAVVDAAGSSPVGDDGAVGPTSPANAGDGSADLPRWWRYNLDGTPRKTCQAPVQTKDVAFGETKRHETDLSVLKALHAGAESLVEVVAATGYVKVTCVRSLERLVEAGRVVQTKAPPTGKRGRPAFVYRPTTEAVEPDTDHVNADDGGPSLPSASASTTQGVEE